MKNAKEGEPMQHQYDFDRPIDRRNTNSFKWDIPERHMRLNCVCTRATLREALKRLERI